MLYFKPSRFYILIFVLLLPTCLQLRGQDTTYLTISEAEQNFVKNNLLVLAQQFQVNKQTAFIIQAKTIQNPNITANFNLYDPENDIVLHTGPTGQKDFMIEQLIQLGGKRTINIEKAKLNKTLAEAEMADLMRNLILSLHTAFYQIYQENNYVLKYNRQLQLLDTLIQSYAKQANLGNVAFKDVVRLKSTYLKLSAEKSESLERMNAAISQLRVITGLKGQLIPRVEGKTLDTFLKDLVLSDLETLALKNRPDLLAQNQQLQVSSLDLKLQQRQRVPDINLNLSTDQRGGAFRNQVNFGLNFALPVFNTNRGNILAAEADLKTANYLLEQQTLSISSEVTEAYTNMLRSITEYKKIKEFYDANFDGMLESVTLNFKKRNLSIIEFVDFLESYSDGIKELERIKSQLAVNAARINYVTASNLYQ